MTTQEAAILLRITLPTSINALKRQFKKCAFQEHPDRSKHPKAAARFLDVQRAYDLLKACADIDIVEVAENDQRNTTSGTPLSELGHGVGPGKNGLTCEVCDGRGYQSTVDLKACPDCRYSGWGSDIVYCYTCRGTGEIPTVKRIYYTCYNCEGIGEKEMFNPVLAKGLLAAVKK